MDEAFAQKLLDRLVGLGVLGAPEAQRAIAGAVRAGAPIETHLVRQLGVPRRAVVATLLELQSLHGVQVGEELVQPDLAARLGGLELARAHHLVPLAAFQDRLYCLVQNDRGPALVPSRIGSSHVVIPLGEARDPAAMLEGLAPALSTGKRRDEPVGEHLVRLGLVTQEALDRPAPHLHGESHAAGSHRQALQPMSADDDALYREVAAFMNVRFYTARMLLELASASIREKLPSAFAHRAELLPLRILGNTLFVAATGGLDSPHDIAPLAVTLGCSHIHAGVTTPAALSEVLESLARDAEAARAAPQPLPSLGPVGVVPQLVESLLREALDRRASDVHIERYERHVEVRYRIDGELVRITDTRVNSENVAGVISKLKTEANLDIAERRRPQDGAFRRHYDARVVDFRLAIQPTIWGENAVMRLLPQGGAIPKLDELGFQGATLALFRRIARNPQGLVLLTGPTGCGKTTTLNAVLQDLRESNLKIVTAEDPVEYTLEGVQQSQVNDAIGNTFERYLRGFLRQDPDVILVGEIRDAPTAEMAVRAAQTGHLVFSTLHVNEAVGAVRRLADLGIEPNLVAQSLLCVMAQRLSRRVCDGCGEPYEPAPELLAEFFPSGVPAGARFRRGKGCAACGQNGHRGRLALVELWAPDDATRSEIEAQATTPALRDHAFRAGMEPLVLDARRKAFEGQTTLEELRGVLPFDQIRRYCT